MAMNKKLVSTIALSSLTAAMLSFSGCGSSSDSSASSTPAAGAWDTTVTGAGVTSTCLTGSEVRGICGVDTTLTLAGSPYKLAGNKIKVVNGATLTVEAGVTVYGESQAYLIVTKGSKIIANGTVADPIVFTSEAAQNGAPAAAGQWGGVTILGNAATNEAESIRYEVDEADSDFAYGGDGTHDAESSGTLSHVQILNSGFAVAPDKEVNGLSLCGIGSGTTIDNITIVDSADDGIELWGGFVNLSTISITGAQDDSFDVDSGYQGTVTDLTVIQTEPSAALIEMTNGGDATKQRTDWTLNGFTLTASVEQKKEGGIYFKDLDVTATIENGTIDMTDSSVSNTGAGLTNAEGVYASAVFNNVDVLGSAFINVQANKKDGTVIDAGTATLNDAMTSGINNTFTSF